MRLLHGTSSTHMDALLSNGLDNPFLTDDYEIARYYAQCAVDEDDDEDAQVVVLEVEVETSALLPDTFAIDEPVMRDEDEVMEAFALVPDNWLSEPDPWRVTMELVSSVKAVGNVRVLGEA